MRKKSGVAELSVSNNNKQDLKNAIVHHHKDWEEQKVIVLQDIFITQHPFVCP